MIERFVITKDYSQTMEEVHSEISGKVLQITTKHVSPNTCDACIISKALKPIVASIKYTKVVIYE